MEDIPNGATGLGARFYEDPSDPHLQHKPSFAASVRLSNEIYEGSNTTTIHTQDGGISAQGASQFPSNEVNGSAPSQNGNVANYEEPMISLSQYETIENGVSLVDWLQMCLVLSVYFFFEESK